MWEKISAFIAATLIPVGVWGSAVVEESPPTPAPLGLTVEPLAISVSETSAPDIDAKAALVIETHSNEVLF